MILKKSDYADNEWPFIFSVGELLRAPGNWSQAAVVMDWATGRLYALNGLAQNIPFVEELDPILPPGAVSMWRDNPDYPGGGLKIDIGPMIAQALAINKGS